jgi:hypothetical protein
MTKRGFRFLQAHRRCRDEADRQRLAADMPAVVEAHDFFTSGRTMARAELEARLLAGEDDPTVAGKCGLLPTGVGAYHDLFFEVRPHLGARDYIVNVVIGAKAHSGLSEHDHDVLLKLFGYAHGPRAVDALIRYYRSPPEVPLSLAALTAADLNELHLMLAVKGAILARTLPSNLTLLRPLTRLGISCDLTDLDARGSGLVAACLLEHALPLIAGGNPPNAPSEELAPLALQQRLAAALGTLPLKKCG